MSFHPPIRDLTLAMRSAGGLGSGHGDDFSAADAETILSEAGKFAAEQIAPLNRVGDLEGVRFSGGLVTTAKGWKETYRNWSDAGWNSLTGPAEFGGQGLPMIAAVACTELWCAANLSFSLLPLLTAGAIEAIAAHASQPLKEFYLPRMVSGVWTGTMNLTEPQSGSDLSTLRCKAERNNDESYRISGTKIFITFGEHDCSENIIHLVLARLNDAPSGTRGISLFLVPKILPDGTRNNFHCASIERKLGIHASPTCTMNYEGAKGWLIGEENRGLNCMFTMMNNARLLVGVQGVGLAERATQAAIAYAAQRKQGKAPDAKDGQSLINAHPDVKRMLLEMQAKTSAARMLCMATAFSVDDAARTGDEAKHRSALLTPLAKSFATDIAVEVASTCVQVHGGAGFVEDTGAAQYYRDARILPIYEGTNGIQAIDLVTRKLPLKSGETLALELQRCAESAIKAEARLGTEPCFATLQHALLKLRQCADYIASSPVEDALNIATPFQRALAATLAGGYLLDATFAAEGRAESQKALTIAKYFIATEVAAATTMCENAKAVADAIKGYASNS